VVFWRRRIPHKINRDSLVTVAPSHRPATHTERKYGVSFGRVTLSGGKLLGLWSQVTVQIEAFEEAFAHVIGQVGFFEGSMHEVNCPLCCI
jgi:hypothetical protein